MFIIIQKLWSTVTEKSEVTHFYFDSNHWVECKFFFFPTNQLSSVVLSICCPGAESLLLLLMAMLLAFGPQGAWLPRTYTRTTDSQQRTALSTLLVCSLHPVVCLHFSTNELLHLIKVGKINSVEPKWPDGFTVCARVWKDVIIINQYGPN